MSAGQLWLWAPPRPVVDRFGVEFFRQIPDAPGVYYLCTAREGVLYVGKARSLRRRLGSYRVANPERLSRRIVRLLFQVERILWDVCESEQVAIERERRLLRVLQPRFNRADVYPPVRYLCVPPSPPLRTAVPDSKTLEAGVPDEPDEVVRQLHPPRVGMTSTLSTVTETGIVGPPNRSHL
jgi:predicted GIY-YIG superfamily endonuclease